MVRKPMPGIVDLAGQQFGQLRTNLFADTGIWAWLRKWPF